MASKLYPDFNLDAPSVSALGGDAAVAWASQVLTNANASNALKAVATKVGVGGALISTTATVWQGINNSIESGGNSSIGTNITEFVCSRVFYISFNSLVLTDAPMA